MSAVFDGDRNETYLLVLNATNLETLALAYTDHVLMWPFHGFFGPSDS